jgi:DNA topoisomerase IB
MRSQYSLGSMVGYRIVKLLCKKQSVTVILAGTFALAAGGSACVVQSYGRWSTRTSGSAVCADAATMFANLPSDTDYLYCPENAPH